MTPDEYATARRKLVDGIVAAAFAWHGYHQDDRHHMVERDSDLFDAVTALWGLNQRWLNDPGGVS